MQLAHVVARETGAQVVRGVEGAGALDVEGPLKEGQRVAVLDPGSLVSIRQMIAIVRGRDAEPIAILAVYPLSTEDIDGVRVLALEGGHREG